LPEKWKPPMIMLAKPELPEQQPAPPLLTKIVRRDVYISNSIPLG
jgi:hypothetical protein